jgi:hypothetical protein
VRQVKQGDAHYLCMIKSDDNNQILSKVFETLSQPYSVFDKMDADI